jgi:hypothetical protein
VLDQVVAAVRGGESERAVALAESSLLPTRFQRDARLIGMMMSIPQQPEE